MWELFVEIVSRFWPYLVLAAVLGAAAGWSIAAKG